MFFKEIMIIFLLFSLSCPPQKIFWLCTEVGGKTMRITVLHLKINDTEQNKIFEKNNKNRIILANNIDESSIIIPNIDYMIDFCLTKEEEYDPSINTSLLKLKWCNRSNQIQRR